ncbi:MAG: hypothetical protein ACIAS6_02025 [Phycisphaerales bacterium JB060]
MNRKSRGHRQAAGHQHTRTPANAAHVGRQRYMTIPGIRRRRPPMWHLALCLVAVAIAFAGLAWVFTGGPGVAQASERAP